MVSAICKQCGNPIVRRGTRRPIFCSIFCKAAWQRLQKPISRPELRRLYVDEGLGTYAIARLVNRDPKRVYDWLTGYQIPIRRRTWDTTTRTKPYHDRNWLEREYLKRKRSASEIARQFGVTENTILFFLDVLKIPRRTMSETRAVKHWGLKGEDNPMFGRTGQTNPHWKGGVTPERQSCYVSQEWKRACVAVWHRDRATCKRCGKKAKDGAALHIHHIVSFAVRAERDNPTNLVLLCSSCHHFVHSLANANGEFLASETRAGCYMKRSAGWPTNISETE
jgi:hypothetical protein